MRGRLTLAVLAGLAMAAPLRAGAEPPTIVVDRAWSRPAPKGRTGAIYMTLTDHGGPDRLVGASTPVAEKAELHATTNDGGVMRMRPVDGIAVAPGEAVKLAPGGYHVMLLGLKQPLEAGKTFPVTLTFEKAGPMSATVTVAQGAGAGMPMDHLMPMDHAMPMGAMHN